MKRNKVYPIETLSGDSRKLHTGFTASTKLMHPQVSAGQISLSTLHSALLRFAGYTYGPLLGLYAFGLNTRLQPRNQQLFNDLISRKGR